MTEPLIKVKLRSVGFRRIGCARADVATRRRELSHLSHSPTERELNLSGRYWLLDLPLRHDGFPYFL